MTAQKIETYLIKRWPEPLRVADLTTEKIAVALDRSREPKADG